MHRRKFFSVLGGAVGAVAGIGKSLSVFSAEPDVPLPEMAKMLRKGFKNPGLLGTEMWITDGQLRLQIISKLLAEQNQINAEFLRLTNA